LMSLCAAKEAIPADLALATIFTLNSDNQVYLKDPVTMSKL